MAVPPYDADPEKSRPYFRRLARSCATASPRDFGRPLPELSMGMSHDFAVAVEEGATEVRIGTALFGPREARVNVGGSAAARSWTSSSTRFRRLQWIVIIAALVSWVNPDPRNPIVRFLYGVTEPLFRPFRRLVPPSRTGGIDLSPLFVILVDLLSVSAFRRAARLSATDHQEVSMRPRMTPLEIQKREFSRKWKGLDPVEVQQFLVDVAEDMEALARENADLETRLRALEQENEEHRERERILKQTLLSAQQASEDIRDGRAQGGGARRARGPGLRPRS